MSTHEPFVGLYDSRIETDSCGNGMIVQRQGKASRALLDIALTSLNNMTHRGAKAADGKSGDGCGILFSLPVEFLTRVAREQGISLSGQWTAGNLFIPREQEKKQAIIAQFEKELNAQGLIFLGSREVPVDISVLGNHALSLLPTVLQVFVGGHPDESNDSKAFGRRLYHTRRWVEEKVKDDSSFFCTTLHPKLIGYKGLVTPENLSTFYPDLRADDLKANVCVYHQRFATNTLPQWRLAQPYRHLAHNGEINTVTGNRNWINIKANIIASKLIDPELLKLDVTSHWDSDSLSLDNVVDLFLNCGLTLEKTLRLLSPPAWRNDSGLNAKQRAMFEYYSFLMEPWDGPMSLMLTDGDVAVCALDRNGLRPVRYVETNDGFINFASETGVYPFESSNISNRGRLTPGGIAKVDLKTGGFENSHTIDQRLAEEHNFESWIKHQSTRLESAFFDGGEVIEQQDGLLQDQNLDQNMKVFNVTREELNQVLLPLGRSGMEGVGSMGDDTPIAALSAMRRSLYDYFRQDFAQVTNPPIDSLRENFGMSLETSMGPSNDPIHFEEFHAKKCLVSSPVLSRKRFVSMMGNEDFPHAVIELSYSQSSTLEQAIEEIIEQASQAVSRGADILVLVEKIPAEGYQIIHPLLATGAIHHALSARRQRTSASIVVATASARDTHQIACLIASGATAVYPWLSFNIMQSLVDQNIIQDFTGRVLRNYRRGLNKGLLKIMSKMGISTIASYRGAQLYQILGIHQEVLDKCFKGQKSPIGGSDWQALEFETREQMQLLNQSNTLSVGGLLKYVNGGEQHSFNPDVVVALQEVAKKGDRESWKHYSQLINQREALAIRDLFRVKQLDHQIDMNLIESRDSILKRFDSAGMSLGALSPEAHSDLARAMNSLGGRSNSGEGGEDTSRFGTEANSKIKQIASGRFGVTPEYLMSAEVLQIKVAQGAKPGEGGQLPGRKVNSMIARLRFSVPGVTLISPPPHHDIYSIEDLAQLIFDLKQINPKALVSVKLVSSRGVGTIAAGVVKAGADLITISGHDGGTAASPLSSIRYAGLPFEIGLAETQQALVANDLRSRVILQADGGLKTGLDVIKAAILGADSFGFGTAPMVALGCKYLRICHLNNCATGVATQHYRLREEHYKGQVADLRNFFLLMADEVRYYLAQMGYESLKEIIGKTQLLEPSGLSMSNHGHLDLSLITKVPKIPLGSSLHFQQPLPIQKPSDLTSQMLEETRKHIDTNTTDKKAYYYQINNTERTVGAPIASRIAERYGNKGLSEPLRLRFVGTAGQSFGAFNLPGMELKIEGDCNDYVGKSMAGGEIVAISDLKKTSNQTMPILGNTCLYGATGGSLFAAGSAGERFAVRNSGATAIIEGAGQHCCEYMTGGNVVVLGETGCNFAAGMTGGMAYVYDVANSFVDQCNMEMVELYRLSSEDTEDHRHNLRRLLNKHVEKTHSIVARKILENFQPEVRNFWLVLPKATSLDTLRFEQGRDAA